MTAAARAEAGFNLDIYDVLRAHTAHIMNAALAAVALQEGTFLVIKHPLLGHRGVYTAKEWQREWLWVTTPSGTTPVVSAAPGVGSRGVFCLAPTPALLTRLLPLVDPEARLAALARAATECSADVPPAPPRDHVGLGGAHGRLDGHRPGQGEASTATECSADVPPAPPEG